MGKFMNVVLLVIMLALLNLSCQQHLPPQPPPQPPAPICGDNQCTPPGENHENCPADCPSGEHGFCGDGICGPAENFENCKRDCPPPPPVCGDGVCSGSENHVTCPDDCPQEHICGDEPLDPDCAPIVIDHTRHIILGNYVGAYGQPDFDWIAYYKLFDKATGDSMHVWSPWNNLEFWPSPLENGKINLLKWYEPWWDHFTYSFEAAAYYDREKEISFIDGYGDVDWQKYHGIARTHPLRTNTSNSNVSETLPLFANWNRTNCEQSKNFYIFKWDCNDEFDISKYKGVNPGGDWILRTIDEAAKRIAPIWKKGKLRLLVRTSNEPIAVVAEDGVTFIRSKGKMLDDRTENYVIKTFLKYGFKVGDRFKVVTENETVKGSVIGPKAMYWPEKTMRMYIEPRNYLMEWHGICNKKDLEFFTKGGSQTAIVNGLPRKFSWKFNTTHFMGSSDGCDEDASYFSEMKEIFKTKPFYFDYKLWACYKKTATCPKPWNDRNMNDNMQVFVPMMEQRIFQ